MAVLYYTDLDVWNKSMDLAVDVYRTVKKLPREEIYALSDQMRRSVVSIPSNIAEGQQRNSTKDFVRFLYVAKGSLSELETQIMLCERLNYIEKKEAGGLLSKCSEIGKMLNGLLYKLNNKMKAGSHGGEVLTTDH